MRKLSRRVSPAVQSFISSTLSWGDLAIGCHRCTQLESSDCCPKFGPARSSNCRRCKAAMPLDRSASKASGPLRSGTFKHSIWGALRMNLVDLVTYGNLVVELCLHMGAQQCLAHLMARHREHTALVLFCSVMFAWCDWLVCPKKR